MEECLRIRGIRACSLALLIALPVVPVALASPQGPPATIRGIVRDSAGNVVRSAQVYLQPGEHHAFADSAGRFTLSDMEAGTYTLQVRRIGWQQHVATVRVAAGEQVLLDIVMRRLPQSLEPVVVRADTVCPRFTWAGVLCRRAEGRGFMMDADEIAAKEPHLLNWVFLYFPGMTVEAVQGGIVPKSKRGWRCIVRLVNGGDRLWGEPPSLRTIKAIEVFHPDEIPPEYAHLAWSRAYGTRRNPMWARCTIINYWTIGPG